MIASVDDYAEIVSQRVASERRAIAEAWLGRLTEFLPVEAQQVFPSDQLLDHIPLLIGAIAEYLRAPEEEEIAANAAVIDKARELGVLRHQQQASVHQLLREYEMLGEILEAFVVEETERLGLQPSSVECFVVLRRMTRSIRALLRTTVETFVSEYTTTIQKRNDQIKTFNRMASHELRSPVGTLLFAAAVLTTEAVLSDPHRLAKVAATVRNNAERLSWLIENLQRLARLIDPLDVPSHQSVDLHTVAVEVARQLEEMAAARGVSIRVDEQLPSLFVDPARLELVLLNLVSNAIKYSDPAKSHAFVDIALVPAADREQAAEVPAETGPVERTCTICVRDNGLGVAEADQAAIFERFFRAHSHLDSELGVTGTGLGLSIVVDCVHALGGSIRCESAVGSGTTFFVTLPVPESGHLPAASPRVQS